MFQPMLLRVVVLALAVESAQAAMLHAKTNLAGRVSVQRFALTADALAAAKAPPFGKDTCTQMFKRMKSLGGTVPPSEFVIGCNEVCKKVKEMKEYWGSGESADHACKTGQAYGCVWVGTPPVTLQDIGC
mmetsp:Transcript_45592/g.145469  ORF Transcript_45592/g.145469 Transcript_45592/m.145469 type:complete len:130 (-) Transcript_45592:69-458(-)